MVPAHNGALTPSRLRPSNHSSLEPITKEGMLQRQASDHRRRWRTQDSSVVARKVNCNQNRFPAILCGELAIARQSLPSIDQVIVRVAMSEDMPERMSADMPDRTPERMSEGMQKICHIECQKECQKTCQRECQKIGHKECQKKSQKECQKHVKRYARKNVRQNVRRYVRKNASRNAR